MLMLVVVVDINISSLFLLPLGWPTVREQIGWGGCEGGG